MPLNQIIGGQPPARGFDLGVGVGVTSSYGLAGRAFSFTYQGVSFTFKGVAFTFGASS